MEKQQTKTILASPPARALSTCVGAGRCLFSQWPEFWEHAKEKALSEPGDGIAEEPLLSMCTKWEAVTVRDISSSFPDEVRNVFASRRN